jgi:outer membrane PBP1 activator LpoA protein
MIILQEFMPIKPLQTSIILLAILLLAATAGCTTSPRAPVVKRDYQGSAEQAFAQRDFEQAARIWQQEAVEARPAQAGAYRVRAADAWLLANRVKQAENLMKWISRADLDSRDRARLDLVLADLALRHERPDEAEQLLRQARPNLSPSSQNRYNSLSAQLQQQLSLPVSRDIARAAKLSSTIDSYDPHAALEVIDSLKNVSSGELEVRADNPRAEQRLTGWLDLALVIRQNLVAPDQVSQAMAGWKARHPYHPLSENEALDLWLRYRQQFAAPRKLAVLLPGSGRLSAAGAAVRDGLMSAFLENPGSTEILFFPTGDEPETAISAYFSAVDAGADWIIGPLQKSSLEAILKLAGLATPILALNEFPSLYEAPPGLSGQIFGISLSQEKEATAIAEHAVRSGFERAVVLAPESSWGERMAFAFQEEFLQENRELIAAVRYAESDNDQSPVIERILKIDESKARKKRLENTLQMTLEFEAVRRNDIDMIFMAVSAAQAKQIRPQLRFHDAGDIPVYATSRVYSGLPNPAGNQDLNGIRFPITPWQLKHAGRGEIPELESIRGGNLASLYTIGYDAWKLLPWLELIRRDPDFGFPGQSGVYRSGNNGNLQREPAWAVFSRGRPIPLQVQFDKGLD